MVAHLKSGKCPKGYKEVRRGKSRRRRCVKKSEMSGTKKGQRRKTARRAYKGTKKRKK